MTQVTLTVKGSPDVAQRAAKARGFEVRSLRNLGRECIIRAEGSTEVACHWFCEPSTCVAGEGYPAGTLLLYR